MSRLATATPPAPSADAGHWDNPGALRRGRRLGLAVAGLAALATLCGFGWAGTAQAVTLRSERSPGWLPTFRAWAANSKAPTAPWAVVLTVAPCGGARLGSQPHGCARLTSKGVAEIRVFASRDTEGRRRWLRSLFYHELGHVFDFWAGEERLRGSFLGILGRAGPWYRGRVGNSPNELFADAYRLCALYGPKASWDQLMDLGWYDWDPTVRQHRAACRLLAA
jgi:hypothetical protein